MVTNIDKTVCEILRREIDTALAAVAAKHGLSISLGNGTYNSANASYKLNIATRASSGEVRSKETTDFKAHAFSFGLKPTDLGAKFRCSQHGEVEIIGLKIKSHTYPILCKTHTGARVKYPASYVVRALAIARPAVPAPVAVAPQRPVVNPIQRPSATAAILLGTGVSGVAR
jgi:hypothetical protein